jgi:tRNA dimethylallyltransferase
LSTKSKILVIFGPTASGKTSLADRLSENYEIISIDSRQIYKYITIAAASPTEEEMNNHKYYLVSFLEPNENYDAFRFVKDAVNYIADILDRGKTPALVGGGGFYLKSLLYGLYDHPPIDSSVSRKIHEIIEKNKKSEKYAWKMLHSMDPNRAEKIHPNDTYRLKRALEICFSGKKPSDFQNQKLKRHFLSEKYDILYIYLDYSIEILTERIENRVKNMLDKGIIDEYEELIRTGYKLSDPGLQSLGYNYIDQYLDNNLDYENLYLNLCRCHRRYAKKQKTFFSSQLKEKNIVGTNFDKILMCIGKWEDKNVR